MDDGWFILFLMIVMASFFLVLVVIEIKNPTSKIDQEIEKINAEIDRIQEQINMTRLDADKMEDKYIEKYIEVFN
jgi:uncharacterized protein YoxC